MVALHGTKIEAVALKEVVGKTKTIDQELIDTAEVFFG
jgi:hypothetical protein